MTGGSGFIGTNVVQKLRDAGHAVVVLDSVTPVVSGVGWRQADITHLDQMVAATRGVDAIYHLAAISNVNVAFANPIACVDVNIKGTATVLEAARLNKLRRVVFASTVWVYQATPDPEPTERSAFSLDQQVHLYTSSKIAGEMLCRNYQHLYGVPYTILRYGIPYGPFMRPELLIPVFIKKVMAGEALTVNGDGSQFRKFVYVDDLACGNLAALAPQAENQTYNLEGTEKVTILQVAQALDRIMGGVRVKHLPARPGDLGGVEVDSEKARRELGWRPHVTFEDGLRRTVEWFLSLPSAVSANGRAKVAV